MKIKSTIFLIIIISLTSFSYDDRRMFLRTQISENRNLSAGVSEIKQKLPEDLHCLFKNLDTIRIQNEFDVQLKELFRRNIIPNKVISLNFMQNETMDSLINDGYYTPHIEVIGTNVIPTSVDGLNPDWKTMDWEQAWQWRPKKEKIFLTDFNLIGREINKDLRIQKCGCLDLIFVGMTNLLLLNSTEFQNFKPKKDEFQINSGDYYNGVYLIKKY